MNYRRILMIGVWLAMAIACDNDDDNGDPVPVSMNLVAEGFTSPLLLLESPDNSGRLFVIEQLGQIFILKDGQKVTQPFLDIKSKLAPRGGSQDERGLLGLAFHPDYAANGRFFVYYSGPLRAGGTAGWNHTNYVSEFKVSANADVANAGSERVLLAMDHPQANHNAGMIAFGKDGYLYVSVGDGGGANDNATGHVSDWYTENGGGNGQDITQNLLGSILRIDVAPATGYKIPADNPFVGKDGMDEIYAYGLRNPYRFCFGPDNKMILSDAGQELYEEIDLVEKGGNYGWNVKEGKHCFDDASSKIPPGSCPSAGPDGNPLIDPVIEFENVRNFSSGLGNASVGGYVYQGSTIRWLRGKYIFGVLTQSSNSVNGAIFAADRSGKTWNYDKLSFSNMTNNELGLFVLGFGQDKAGEVYVMTNGGAANSGKVYKIGQ